MKTAGERAPERARVAAERAVGPRGWAAWFGDSWLGPALLTPVVLAVQGYHPLAGDAGIYVAGVRHVLDPKLYPLNAAFVTAFTRLSAFAWAMAAVVRLLHVKLEWVLLGAYLLSAWLLLEACRQAARRLFEDGQARGYAVLLAAGCFTLPVAGTALFVMDPYVTARSLSTPLGLLAVTACMDRAWVRMGLLLAATAAVHPLMAVYTAAFVLLYGLGAAGRWRTAGGICLTGLAACGAAFAAAHGMRGAEATAAYRQCVGLAPRRFLFLWRWRWYEMLGLALPLALMGLTARRWGWRSRVGTVCGTSILVGSTSVLIAALFVPANGPYLLVPVQVLRSFHLIYVLGVVLCGGAVAALGRHWPAAGVAVVGLVFAGMALAEGASWSGCRRLELPGLKPVNPYVQAFLWVRGHTPQDAVFAFNPRLDYRRDEDEQGFRAIAERDQLADDKDAGVAAVIPRLAPRWARQRNAELRVDSMTDAERLAVLRPLGATWVMLRAGTPTTLPCPYANSVVRVCRLQPPSAAAATGR